MPAGGPDAAAAAPAPRSHRPAMPGRFSIGPARRLPPALLAAAACGAVGCAGLPASADPPARVSAADGLGGEDDGGVRLAGAESPAGDSPFYEDDELGASAAGRLGKTRAWLQSLTGKSGAAGEAYAAVPADARRRFAAAKSAAERGEHAAAAGEFKRLARRYPDTEIEQDCLFLHAESLYAQDRLAPAQDAYDTLLDRYPGTRHIDVVSKRQFETARRWLGFPEVVRKSDVRPVSYAAADLTPAPTPAKKEPERPFDLSYAVPLVPNFVDKSRPLFDTKGRAMQALKSVWMNDPTGQYADDALMLTASHHLRRGDNMEADRVYEILRKEYPESPYLEDAYVLGSHARAVVWQGAQYDDAALEESRALKESTLRLFPDSPQRTQIREELAKMGEAAAERDWALVTLYRKKGKDAAVAIYCQKMLTDHPGSKYAAEARRLYDVLPASAKAHLPPLGAAPAAAADPPRPEPSGAAR